ncbi:MAG TPA: PilZ domain-containing protein [Thermoanaerobaculia bacterium]|nr:PilZ domain-containing protein [Thermoanaerobaculia bacterium]
MNLEAARNLRTAERFLLAPPLAATFGNASVAVCDISAKGVRFRHDTPLENGAKAILKVAVDGRATAVTMEALIVWSQADPSIPGKYMSGCRTYGPAEVIQSLLTQLQTSHRTSRIEELRSTDRFYISPSLTGLFDAWPAQIEDISARGARVESHHELTRGATGTLRFTVPQSSIDVVVTGQVAWTAVKAITGSITRSYRAGLFINEKPELLRLAIGLLCEQNRAALDTQSLRLKLKVIRARARQMAPSFREIEASGIPAEQFLLIQGVREELRLNPEEAMHWYRRARLVINDPATRAAAPPIANHPDALAVWEYLDRSVDPTIVGRAFELPLH